MQFGYQKPFFDGNGNQIGLIFDAGITGSGSNEREGQKAGGNARPQ